jgi:hypothetical protein
LLFLHGKVKAIKSSVPPARACWNVEDSSV